MYQPEKWALDGGSRTQALREVSQRGNNVELRDTSRVDQFLWIAPHLYEGAKWDLKVETVNLSSRGPAKESLRRTDAGTPPASSMGKKERHDGWKNVLSSALHE